MKRVIVLLVVAISITGCNSPNAANIKLRKENHELRTKVEDLERARQGDQATIRSLESHATTVPTLPGDQLSQLFTVHGLQFGKLTGEFEGKLKVYVVPTDQHGQPLKAAGSFVVDAFDLAKPGDNRTGHWEFGLDQAPKNWFGQAMLYTYVLECPWTQKPEHEEVTLRISFVDALTHRTFNAQKIIRVQLGR